MAALRISIDQEAFARLQRASEQLGRSVEDLAESAVEEAALAWWKDNERREVPHP